MVNEYRDRLLAALGTVRARPLRSTFVGAGVLMFLLLLSGSAGVAVLVGLLIGPFVVLFYLTRLHLYEREPWPLLAAIVGAGALVGLVGGFLSAVVFDRFWFNDSRLNLGAVGFSGISANGEGSVPFAVLLLDGILIPVLTGAAVLGGPIVLRRWPVFRNEITDGMTLGALAAGGFATISAFVYFWPSAFDDLPDRPVSDWTALLAGIVIVRPVVLILAGSLLGIAAWQYSVARDVRSVLVAGIAGIFGWLALPLGSLLLTRSGAVPEFIWYAVVLVVVVVLFRHAVGRGLALDRQVLRSEAGDRRVVCPNCRRVTPDGSFCSFCRAPLHPESPAALNASRVDDPASPEDVATTTFPPASSDVSDGVGRPIMSTGPVGEAGTDDRDQETAPERAWIRDDDAEADPRSQPTRPMIRAPRDVSAPGEPEADESGELDWSTTSTLNLEETEPTPAPHPARSSSPGAEPPHDSSSFKSAPGWNATSRDATPDPTEPERSVIGDAEDEGVFPTDESSDRTLPISIQDWTRRSTEPAAARDAAETDNRDPNSFEGATDRLVVEMEPAAEPSIDDLTVTSPTLWPTTADTPDEERDVRIDPAPFDFGRSRVSSERSTHQGELPNPLNQSDRPTVLSGSGRWFDASIGQSRGVGTVTTSSPEEERRDDPSALASDTDEPVGFDPGAERPVEDLAETSPDTEATAGKTSPSGIRWYRQDEDVPPSDYERLDTFEQAQGTTEIESVSASTESEPGATSERSSASSPETPQRSRTGIWRALGRQGRSGGPRAPQRDHDSGGAG